MVIPPSPKNNAWIRSAIDSDSIEAQGPSTTVAAPTPTACPVVPPGRGTLNIMMTKQNALATASSGTSRVLQQPLDPREGHIPEGYGGCRTARRKSKD